MIVNKLVFVEIHSTSKKKQIFSGVPQGFILGPELLIMFINITYVNNRTFYEHDTKCIIKS